MENGKFRLYLTVTEDFREECLECIAFRLADDKIITYHGYAWDGVNNSWKLEHAISKNIRLFQIGNYEGEVYRNIVWFSVEKESKYYKYSEADLYNKAVQAFIAVETYNKDQYVMKVKKSIERIKQLQNMIKLDI